MGDGTTPPPTVKFSPQKKYRVSTTDQVEGEGFVPCAPSLCPSTPSMTRDIAKDPPPRRLRMGGGGWARGEGYLAVDELVRPLLDVVLPEEPLHAAQPLRLLRGARHLRGGSYQR